MTNLARRPLTLTDSDAAPRIAWSYDVGAYEASMPSKLDLAQNDVRRTGAFRHHSEPQPNRHYVADVAEHDLTSSWLDPHPVPFGRWYGGAIANDERTVVSLISRAARVIEPRKRKGPLGLAISELGRLQDGWAGPDTKAPSNSILRDIQACDAYLPAGTVSPDVEVDEDDGFVTLRWIDEDGMNSLSISFFGGGKIVIAVSSLAGNGLPAREFNMQKEREIASYLADQAIEDLLKPNAVR